MRGAADQAVPERCHHAVACPHAALHRQMKAPYGVIKLWRALRLIGARCGRHRVARPRRQYSLIAHGGSGRVLLELRQEDLRLIQNRGSYDQ